MLIRLKHLKTCLFVIIMSLCGISMSLPVHSMQSPLKRSNQGKKEEQGYEGLRHSVETKFVKMNTEIAQRLIIIYLTHHDINEKNFNHAIQLYLDRLIKLPQKRGDIEAFNDAPFSTNIMDPFFEGLIEGKVLSEDGEYILKKTMYEAMIENAVQLFKDHYSETSPKQKLKNVGAKIAKKLSKKSQSGSPLSNVELAPEYQVVKKTASVHGLLLMKLLRSAASHQIKLEGKILSEAKDQAVIFLASLGLEEDAIAPLIRAFLGIKEKKRDTNLRGSQEASLVDLGKKGINWNKKVVLVLSLDGGGTRGLYTARLLQDIEARCNRYISEIFDVIAGTSTGGILALALNMPAGEPYPPGKPKYSAKDAVKLYTDLAQTIFPKKHKVSQVFWTIYDTQFDASVLENLLNEEFGEITLDKTLKNVVIPAYNIKNGRIKVFKTRYAIREPLTENPRLSELARYTSAAPTYLSAAERSKSEVYMDGGIGTNNPSHLAYTEAQEAYPNAKKIILISLGTTGELKKPQLPKGGLVSNLEKVLGALDVQSQIADEELERLAKKNPEKFTYIRISEVTNEAIDLAKSDDETLKKLISLAEKTIDSPAWQNMIAQLHNFLREDMGGDNLRAAKKDLRSSSTKIQSSGAGLRSSRPFN